MGTEVTLFKDSAIISLTKGQQVIIDREDFPKIPKHGWYYKRGYAVRGINIIENGKRRNTTVTMHRTLMSTPHGMETDHINGNRLDNRKENLRICNHKQNAANSKKRKLGRTLSNYKGVYWHKQMKKWYSTIAPEGKSKYLGMFLDPIDAAKAYDNAATKYFGEFARLNF